MTNEDPNQSGSAPGEGAVFERAFVRRRIERRDLVTLAQPIVDLSLDRVIGYEALSRWPTSTAPSCAARLFDAAARHGMLDELEDLTLGMSLSREWPEDAFLFLNCTPRAVAREGLAPWLRKMLAQRGVEPRRVVIEITERFGHADQDALVAGVARLREVGVGIAMDDFGAGTNGLARLLAVSPDWVKLDRALIRDIDTDPMRRSLVKGLARFSEDAGISVLAEGVERDGELEAVRALGIRFAQGYLLGVPRSADAVARRAA